MKRIMRSAAFTSCAVAVLMGSAASASAQQANGLGEKGELIVTADRLLPILGYTNESVSTTQGNNTTTTSDSSSSFALLFGREPSQTVDPHTIPRIAFDYAVIPHLTVGGAFVLGIGFGGSHKVVVGNNTSSTDAPTITAVGFAPRVGYVLAFTQTFGFWPRAGFAFYSLSSKTLVENNNNNPVTTTNKDTVWSLDLDPQFVWVPMQHFFAHFGPLVNIPFAGSRSITTDQGSTSSETKVDYSVFHIGLSAGLGGWFDL